MAAKTARITLTLEEVSALEDVLAYYTMAASPGGSFGGTPESASEEEAEVFGLAESLLDRMTTTRQRVEIF